MTSSEQDPATLRRQVESKGFESPSARAEATMTTKSADTDLHAGEEEYDWHGLPGMIGDAITSDHYGVHGWGGYLVRKTDQEAIVIYRVVDHAPTRDELETEGDFVTEIWDAFEAGVEIGRINPPDGGWETEVEALPESIFAGYE